MITNGILPQTEGGASSSRWLGRPRASPSALTLELGQDGPRDLATGARPGVSQMPFHPLLEGRVLGHRVLHVPGSVHTFEVDAARPNESRLSCGALKKNSFLNLRAPAASSAG